MLISFFTKTGCTTVQFAPSFYNVLPKLSKSPAEAKTTEKTPQSEPAQSTAAAYPNTSASFVTSPKHTGKNHCKKLTQKISICTNCLGLFIGKMYSGLEQGRKET